MRLLGRTLGAIVTLSLIIVVGTFTVRFIRHNWFSGGAGSSRIAVVELTGVIWNSAPFLKKLEGILDDKGIKALVVRINSPGGVVAPSQEMYEGIRKVDAKIPVIVSMGSLAASGGYYAALGGRQIFANSGTLTGSIGVIMEFANTQKLYQWAKIDRYTLKSGKFKDMGSPLRNMTEEERSLMTQMMEDIHGQFRAVVKERRKLEDAALAQVTDGRILVGSQAQKAGLVDNVGGIQEAIAAAKTAAGLPQTAAVDYVHEKRSFLQNLVFGDDDAESRLSKWISFLDDATRETSPGWRAMLIAPLAQ